jgi:hypothetical protein
MWKYTVERDGPQMTIWRMRIACRIPMLANKHTGCIDLIAFPQQQWLYERASMLRYTYEGNSIRKLQIVIEKNRMEIMIYKQHLFFNIISTQI